MEARLLVSFLALLLPFQSLAAECHGKVRQPLGVLFTGHLYGLILTNSRTLTPSPIWIPFRQRLQCYSELWKMESCIE